MFAYPPAEGIFQRRAQVHQRPSPPIKSPDHNRIKFPATGSLEQDLAVGSLSDSRPDVLYIFNDSPTTARDVVIRRLSL